MSIHVPSPVLLRTNARPFRRRSIALVAALIASMFSLGFPASASATPGGNNFALFVGNGGDPTNGTIYFYDNATQVAANRAGSGTSNPTYNSPCNKYWGAGDPDASGGRIPYTSWENYDSNLWPYGWSASQAPFNPGLRLSDGVATGSTFDCAGSGSITRDGLWVHNWNNNYITQGCIKMNPTDLFWFDVRFHSIWGGSDGVSYYDTVGSW